jgi:serine/threonine protein kinase
LTTSNIPPEETRTATEDEAPDCQSWIEKIVETFLGQEETSDADSYQFIGGVPEECKEVVKRLLSRMQFLNQFSNENSTVPAWQDEYQEWNSLCAEYDIEELGKGGMGRAYLVKAKDESNSIFEGQDLISAVLSPESMPTLELYQQLTSPLAEYRQPLVLKIPISPRANDDNFIEEIWNIVLVPPHGNLVTWKYIRKLDEYPCILMEYMEGGSVADLLDPEKQNPWASSSEWLVDFFDVAIQSTWALEHLHEHQLIHQDISPTNILFRENGSNAQRVGLSDFGVSRFMTPERQEAEVVGWNRDFRAPEQLEGIAGKATDIYSLGKVLSRLIGVHPATNADHTSLSSLIEKMTREDPQERIDVNNLVRELLELHEQLAGIPYPHKEPVLENSEELSRKALDELSKPSSVLFDVAQLWSQATGLERQLDDIKQFYVDLVKDRDQSEGARLSLLIQIIFLRALKDGHIIWLEELRKIIDYIQPVIKTHAKHDLPPAYAEEYRQAICPALEFLAQFSSSIDDEKSAEIDRILAVFNSD